MNGLVIKSPWMERILEAPKTWIIRGSRTSTRGRIALIKSRSSQIVGMCQIEDCIGPLTLDELKAQAELHRIPVETLTALPHTRTYAWVLSEVKVFVEPIAYKHPSGSVVWVKLTPENVPGRYGELEGQALPPTPAEPKVEVTITPLVAELQAQAAAPSEPEVAPCPVQTEAA